LSGGVAAFSAFKWQPLIKRCRIRFLFALSDLRGGNCSKKATTKKLAMHFRDNEIGKRIQRGARFLAHVSKASPFVPPLNQHTDCPGVALKDYSAGAQLGSGS